MRFYFELTVDANGRLRLWKVYATHRELLNDDFIRPEVSK